jgi:hypothetical protein
VTPVAYSRRVRRLACLLVLALTAGAGCSQSDTPRGQPEAGPPAEVASADTVAPRRPPPLRATKVPVPALPDLPALSGQAPPAARGGSTDGNPCHAVWSGTSTAPFSCAKSLLFFDRAGSATRIVPRSLLAHDPSVLPAVVDHRVEGTEGPVRDQNTAPACTAFAEAAALDHALARWGGGNPAVSVMQIWSRYHSPEVIQSLTSNVGMKLGAESEWPYNVNEAMAWVPCSEYSRTPRQGCGRQIDAAREKRVSSSVVGEFTEVEYIGKSADTIVLEAKLAAGQDVMVTIEPPPSLVARGKPGARYVADYTRSAGSGTGHSMLVAGYAHFPHGTYFLLHNSWGASWGDGGYAWMHESTLWRWSLEVIAVDAEPLLRIPGSRRLRERAQTTCASGLVPDSIRATCAPPCPDGSPRQDGICAIPGQCPPGYVNLTGACQLAAPTARGRDPDTGVSWSCGPGGCSYAMPRGSDSACTGSICQASCPAPDFILAKMGSELVCIE